jgi:hypothetical protein
MSELVLPAVSQAPSVREILQEAHVQESIASERHHDGETENRRIVDHINNGLSPEQIDNRLNSELQQPEVQRQLIDELSPYTDQITPYIKTTQELSVYTQNGLQESKILDRPCLQLDINPETTDAMGRSNRERMEAGRAPIDENGDPVNLHHIGQKENSPLAELPDRVHKECDAVLHDKSIPTEIHGEDSNWNVVRSQYWRERASTL